MKVSPGSTPNVVNRAYMADEKSNKNMIVWFAAAISATLVLIASWKVLLKYLWRPLAIQRDLQKQGLKGRSYRFLFGNIPETAIIIEKGRARPMEGISHSVLPQVLPYYAQWCKLYGEQFYFWYGSTPRITVPDPELVKEVLLNKFGHYHKSLRRPDHNDFLGNGLVVVNGETWAFHRRIVSPAFHLERLKTMIPTIVETANSMFERWERLVREADSYCSEMEVLNEFRTLTADVIARTAFGSSYKEGKQVFEMQHEQQYLISEADCAVYIPGSRFLPTRRNRYRWKLDRQIQVCLRKIIQSRLGSASMGRSDGYGKDLLGLMLMAYEAGLQGRQKTLSFSIQDVVDECKNFLFAGHETTSALLAWTTMLLAQHADWQERARAEVFAECGTKPPDSEALSHLKIVTMVLNESLRLYPPAILMIRYASKNICLGRLVLQKGTSLVLPILALHHSPEMWGDDVNEFNPQRFAQGVAKAAKHPQAFMPFSMGPRFCVGQNFAMLEAKAILAMMLQRFTFTLSPAYKHAPTNIITMQPRFGVQIMLKTIE